VHVDFLAERVRQPREPAHRHPHREVLTLDVAGRDVLRVGVAGHVLRDATQALGRAVPRIWLFAGRAVELHEHRVIDIASEGILDG
jgi:hypothetical protein